MIEIRNLCWSILNKVYYQRTFFLNKSHNYIVWCLFSTGSWSFGLASMDCDLNKLPLGNDSNSWVLSCDGSLRHDKVDIDTIDLSVAEGDYMVK